VSLESQLIATGGRPRAVSSAACFWILLAAVFVVRLAYLAVFPCELSGEEASVWAWGRRLSLGYCGQMPLIAWILALADFVGVGSAYGIRAFAVLFGCGTMIATFALGKALYDEKVGFWSAAATAALPGSALLSIFLTTDAILVFFWTGSLCLFALLVNGKNVQRRAVAAAFLIPVLGFGHLSDRTLWLFPPLGILYLLFAGTEGREKLRLPGLWLTLAGSYLFLVPTLLWNARAGHSVKTAALLSVPNGFGDFALTQVLHLSPILALLVFFAVVAAIAAWKKLAPRERLLTIFGAGPLGILVILALFWNSEGGSAAAFYPAAIVLVTGWSLSGRKAESGPWRLSRKWFFAGVGVAVFATGLLYALPFLGNEAGFVGTRWDPFALSRGWKPFAASVEKARATLPERDAPILVVGQRIEASELAFYLPGRPRVYYWANSGAAARPCENSGVTSDLSNRNLFIVSTVEGGRLPDNLRACLSGSTPKGIVTIKVDSNRNIRASFYWSGFLDCHANALEVISPTFDKGYW
jgi:4-amino-4-deoxy-L-arabinose transferase-like glycosyltransferase